VKKSRDSPFKLIGHALALAVAAAIAIAVHLPSLKAPLLHDDYAQRAMVAGQILPKRSAFNLYDFIADDNRALLLDRGAIPWWCSRDLTIRFLRPLSSALVWLDVTLFGSGSAGPHAHSLFWWALAVVAVGCLLRRVLSAPAALIGAFVFAVAPSQTGPLLWLANRGTLVCTALGSFGLLFYVRWREGGARGHGLVADALFTAAFCAGEYAFAFAGYVAAFEVVCAREPPFRRIQRSVPFVVPLLGYLGAHRLLGYGTHGTGFYIDPLRQPLAYLSAAPRRALILAGEAWGTLDDGELARNGDRAATLIGAGTLVVAGVLVGLALSDRLAHRRPIAWLAGGAALAMIPALSSEPSARVLDVVAIGVAGSLGSMVDTVWGTARGGFAVVTARLLTGLFLIAQTLGGSTRTLHEIRMFTATNRAFEGRIEWLREHLNAPISVVLQAITPPAAFWTPFALGDRAPARWRVLSFQPGDLVAIRTGPSVLEVSSPGGSLFPAGPFDLFREPGTLREGEVFEMAGMRTTVLQLDTGGHPTRVRFELDRNLDDRDVQTLSERQSGFEEVAQPAVHFGVRLGR